MGQVITNHPKTSTQPASTGSTSGSTSSTSASGPNPIENFNVNNDVLDFVVDLTLTLDQKVEFFGMLNEKVKLLFSSLFVSKIKKDDRHVQFDEYSRVYENLTEKLSAYKAVYKDPVLEPDKLQDVEDYFNTTKLSLQKQYQGKRTILEASVRYIGYFNNAYSQFISRYPQFKPATPTTPAPTPPAPTPSGLVSRPVTTAPVSTPGRTLVAYDFCTGILSEAQGVKDDFYNYWVARQLSWQPGVTDQNILIGQVATRYTQLVDYTQQYDNETNPTEKKRIQNEMLSLNRDSFFVDESNKSLRGYDQSVLDEINSFLADMKTYADTYVSRSIVGTGLNSYFSKVKGQKQMMTKRSQLSKPISPPVQTFSGLGSYFSKVKQKQSKYIRF